MRGIHLEEFDERGRTTELWAGGAEYSKDGGELRLSDVRILAEPKEGERSRPFELTGDRGVYHVKAQSARVEGNVRIRSQEGYVLSTDSATLFQDKREIEGPGEVLLEGPEGMTEGVGLHVWMNEEKVLLRQTVRTLLRPSALQRAKEVLR
jgi:LPS export ABC transporter protein LptC